MPRFPRHSFYNHQYLLHLTLYSYFPYSFIKSSRSITFPQHSFANYLNGPPRIICKIPRVCISIVILASTRIVFPKVCTSPCCSVHLHLPLYLVQGSYGPVLPSTSSIHIYYTWILVFSMSHPCFVYVVSVRLYIFFLIFH